MPAEGHAPTAGFIGRHGRAVSAAAVATAFGLVVIGLLALGYTLARLHAGFDRDQRTDNILMTVSRIEGNMFVAESGVRGYLLTSNKDFVDAIERAQTEIKGGLTTLREWVSEEPRQVARIDRMRTDIDTRFTMIRRVIAVGPSHLDEALELARSAEHRRMADVVHADLLAFQQSEIDLLEEQQARESRDATVSTVLAGATTILATLTAGFGLFLFQRERARHREREMQTEMIHLSRIDMMGQTASMLAHELNQPLSAARNYLAAMRIMLKDEENPPSRRVEVLQAVTAQIVRAGAIVERLRSFMRKGETARSVENLENVFAEAIALANLRRDGLEINARVEPGMPPVLIDKIQIQQVLINLMRNAAEAMQQSERQVIDLSARAGDGQALIRVKDTGPGVAKEIADTVFGAFVSTKRSGMGVGLSICTAIVERHGGRIWVESPPGDGATFCFTVPLAAGPPAAL